MRSEPVTAAVLGNGPVILKNDAGEIVYSAAFDAPQPDPASERSKVLTTYDADMHDYSVEKPSWCEIEPEHFVLGNRPELDEYRKRLEGE